MQRHGGKTVVATYAGPGEAEIAASALRANGFEAVVTADDCAGMDPYFHVLLGVHVVVPEDEAGAATEFLAELRESPAAPDEGEGAPLPAEPYRRQRPVFWTVAAVIIGLELIFLAMIVLDEAHGLW